MELSAVITQLATRLVARRQRFGLGHDVQHDCTRLEHFDVVILVGRDLPEGLPLAIARRRLNLRIDQDRMVGQFRLFQRPADPEVPP